jgi:hypothetical protein
MPSSRRHASVLGPSTPPLHQRHLLNTHPASLQLPDSCDQSDQSPPLVAYVAFVAAFFIRQTSAGRPPVLTFSTVAKLALWSTPRARSMRAALR